MSNSALFDQLAQIGSTLNHMTARMETIEREQRSRGAPNPSMRIPPTAPRRGEPLRAPEPLDPGRNRRPGKEPIVERGRSQHRDGRVGRRFPEITPRALTYGEGENHRHDGRGTWRSTRRVEDNVDRAEGGTRRAVRRPSPVVERLDRARSRGQSGSQPREMIYDVVPFQTVRAGSAPIRREVYGSRGRSHDRTHGSMPPPRGDPRTRSRESRSQDPRLGTPRRPQGYNAYVEVRRTSLSKEDAPRGGDREEKSRTSKRSEYPTDQGACRRLLPQ